jgi:uncharacterized membrane protein
MNWMDLTWPEDRERRPRGWSNVGGTERWASLAIGAGLLVAAFASRERTRGALTAAGGAFLVRGASGFCPVSATLGRDTAHGDDTREALGGPRGVHVKESITIGKPVAEMFAFWRQLDNLPRFMRHLKSVRVVDERRSHWVAKAPAGMTVSWDAEIHNEVPNQIIAWRSLPGADVVSAGAVNFADAGPDRGTRVTVHLQYDPPGGKLGAWFATLFGEEPSQQIREDLRRLKQLLEAGEALTTDGQSSGRARDRKRRKKTA